MWEVAEYVGELLVFLGVVGEIYAEWEEPHKDKLAKVSSVVLVIGLAVSLASLIGTNESFNSTIANLNLQAQQARAEAAQNEKEAAQARKDAAEANARAAASEAKVAAAEAEAKASEAKVAVAENESKGAAAKVATADARIAEAQKGAATATEAADRERLAEAQLEVLVAPRRLTLDQQEKIGKACSGMNRGVVDVSSYGMDTEGKPLAKQVAYAVFDHTFPVNFDPGGIVTTGGLDEGVLISGPASSLQYMNCLADAFATIGNLQSVTINGERHSGTTLAGSASLSGGTTMQGSGPTIPAGPKPEGTPVEIFVGIKPVKVDLKP